MEAMKTSVINSARVFSSTHGYSAMELSNVQMGSSMTIAKKVAEKTVDILRNENIPKVLKNSDEYVYRHMGNSLGSTQKMLKALDCDTMEQFIDQVVPDEIRLSQDSMFKHDGKELHGIDSETLMTERMRQLASNNIVNKSYIGQGYYGTTTPAVIRRNVLENPKWYTPYTPY